MDVPPARRQRFGARDVLAGVSVALVLIPQSMAYAELAGLPPHVGLRAAALPPILAALFASSPYLQTGPVALTALLTFGALIPLAPVGSPEFVGLAALLALIVGLTRVIIGLVRAGAVAYLMSQPVLEGFASSAALLIMAAQLPGATGVAPPMDGVIPRTIWALGNPGEWEWTSIVLTAGTLGVIFGARRLNPVIPGVVIATAGGLIFSVLVGYEGPQIGEIPGGFPLPTLDLPWSRVPTLVLPGVVIALVGFAEAASIAQTFSTRERRPWDPNREFVSQGAANLAAGISGGFPVGGSFTRSSLNHLAGAKTRWSGAITGATVLLFFPLAGILSPLPRAVLAGIVIAAVSGLVRIRPLLAIWRLSRPQALVAWATFILTLALVPHLEQALLLGILLALGVHLWRELSLGLHSWTENSTLHLAPRGVLWFGSAPEVEKALSSYFSVTDHLERVVFHLGGLGRLDYTGALVLKRFVDDLRSAGLEVTFEGVPAHALRIIRRVLDWTPPTEVRGDGRPEADVSARTGTAETG